jgi:hypothetical protein
VAFPNSEHTKGTAADCFARRPDGSVYNLRLLAFKAEIISHFDRIGIYPDQNFLHLDIKKDGIYPYWVGYKNKELKYYKTIESALEYIEKNQRS